MFEGLCLPCEEGCEACMTGKFLRQKACSVNACNDLTEVGIDKNGFTECVCAIGYNRNEIGICERCATNCEACAAGFFLRQKACSVNACNDLTEVGIDKNGFTEC